MTLSLEASGAPKAGTGGVLQKMIVSQFRKPQGVLGALAGWIMANRRSNIARNQWTVDLLNLPPEANVLEIGCGPGVGLQSVLEEGAEIRVTGLDHSGLMIERAARRLEQKFDADRWTVRQGTIEDLQSDERYDAAFSCNVLQFVADREGFLDRVKNRLKPAGLFATTYQPRGACASVEAGRDWIGGFAEDLCKAGFLDVDIHEEAFGDMPAFCALSASPV